MVLLNIFYRYVVHFFQALAIRQNILAQSLLLEYSFIEDKYIPQFRRNYPGSGSPAIP